MRYTGRGVGYSRFGILLALIVAGMSPSIISQLVSGVECVNFVSSPRARRFLKLWVVIGDG